ncbi:MAG: excinuclease ABC subunit UvrC [Deltaproteobacteria bacterium]
MNREPKTNHAGGIQDPLESPDAPSGGTLQNPVQSMNQASASQHDLDPGSLRHTLPDGPGVYLFKDRAGQIIYVGKAKSLKKRVLSYFKSSGEVSHKTAIMMNRAKGLDIILTSTDKEAFILESHLIKKHLPRYNIVLRDDKQYPWLRFDVQDTYPRLTIVRKPKKDGARYFGPFSSANSVRSTLKLIDRIFQLRKCEGRGVPRRSRPCLNYQLDRCLGPCSKKITPERYKEIVHQVILFLEGRSRELVEALRKDMELSAENLDFERAARIRDQIKAVERTVERQQVASAKSQDQDVIGLAQKNGTFQLAVLFIRKGYLTGSRDYIIRSRAGSPSEVIEAFLKQHYPRQSFIPKHILISDRVEDMQPITEWLSDIAGRKVSIKSPSRGDKRRLVRLAVANAENLLAARVDGQDLLVLAQVALKLGRSPRFIEGLDISNLGGNMAVGAVVSFVDGQPYKSGYRNYRIRDVKGIDDYAMMSELVSRRLSKDKDPPPDLFVVDGGKGHLQAVKRVVTRLNGDHTPDLVAIAKEDEKGRGEKIYIPGRKNPLPLKPDHPVVHLLMRVRDEAHRRAVTYHRKLRGKGLKESLLDSIPGVGKKRKKRLLEHFGDVEMVSKANEEDLMRVSGIPDSVAKNIVDFFKRL